MVLMGINHWRLLLAYLNITGELILTHYKSGRFNGNHRVIQLQNISCSALLFEVHFRSTLINHSSYTIMNRRNANKKFTMNSFN